MGIKEFKELLDGLDLSVRSYNVLMRAYGSEALASNEDYHDDRRKAVMRSLQAAESYRDLKDVVTKHYRDIRNMGVRSYQEILSKCDEKIQEGQPKRRGWTSIDDGLPPAGVPLMIRYSESIADGMVYPVYYMKDPYMLCWKWMSWEEEGCLKVLPTGVTHWKEIKVEG